MVTAPQDRHAAHLDPVPGKAVIYIVRTPMDSREASSLALDDREQITTLRGTYYRWEVDPGTYRLKGVGPTNESITLSAGPGSVHFLEHTVTGTLRSGVQLTAIRAISPEAGRTLVLRSERL